jgi:hypothetical protein
MNLVINLIGNLIFQRTNYKDIIEYFRKNVNRNLKMADFIGLFCCLNYDFQLIFMINVIKISNHCNQGNQA